MICESCAADNRPGSRFCDQCGASMAVPCPSCGEANRPDARFCASCGAALGAATLPVKADAPARPPAAAERRLVTVLFSDIVGFTTFAEDRDPEAVRELLSRYFDMVTAILERHGGIVEKFIGDAIMAVWGTPIAHEDDAERAVRAALEVVDSVPGLTPGLQARIGVLTGEAAVTVGAQNQGMVAGDLVNTAARLQGVAEAGTVLVGESTMRAAANAVVFEAIGEHSLKGKTAPVPAWCAVRVVSGRGGQGRGEGLEAPFVGRAEELRLLKDQLHAAGRDRRVRLVSLSGPGGIGKSRLVWELEKYIDGVTEDVYWHRGRSPSYGEGVTFWALGEMVRRRAGLAEDADDAESRDSVRRMVETFVPDAGERERLTAALLALLGLEDGPARGRETLFPAWRTFFERIAEHGTTVLVFEDLQWADAGLLDFIDHLVEWSRSLPMLVITLARPELLDRRPEWGAGRRHFTSLALDPLPDEAMRELLAGLVPGLPPDAVEAIVRRADGIPLYAVETVRALLADGRIRREGDRYLPVGDLRNLSVPESLRSLIASRLDALDPAARSLVQDASVLGQVFPPDVLGAVAALSGPEFEARLRDLVRRELFEIEVDPQSPERGQYKFVQSLIREVAYATLARRDRRARHLAVARHYESTTEDETSGVLAGHYLAAHAASEDGAEADAIAAQARVSLGAAATRAASLGAHEQAVAYLEQAVAITPDQRERAALLERAAESAAVASRADAEVHARKAVAAYQEVGDELGRTRASARLAKVLLDLGDLATAVETLERTLTVAEGLGDRGVLAETLATLARAYMRTLQDEAAVRMADRALAIAEVDNLEPIVAEGLVNKGSALAVLGRRREGVAVQAAALEIARRSGLVSLELRIRNNLAAAMMEDDPAGATRLMLESMAVAAQVGDRGHYRWLAGSAAYGRYFEGREWDEHAALLREIVDVSTVAYERHRVRAALAVFETARGEHLDRIVPELDEIAPGDASPDVQAQRDLAAGDIAFVEGRHTEAYELGMKAATSGTQNPEFGYELAARSAIHARDLDRLQAARAGLQLLPLTGALMTASKRHTDGAIAALEGRIRDATALFREAHAEVARVEQHFEAAKRAIDAVTLLPGEKEVRARAVEIRPLLEELRAAPYLALLDAALAGDAAAPDTSSPVAATVSPA